MATGEFFAEFQPDYSITGKKPKGFSADRSPKYTPREAGAIIPPIGQTYREFSRAGASGVTSTLATRNQQAADTFEKAGIEQETTLSALAKMIGAETNGYQKGVKALMAGWDSGGLKGMASALFGGGATSLLGPIAGGLSGLFSGYTAKRDKEKDRKIAQQLADAKTLDVAKSPGGFRWDDPENKPDKYLDGTITKGNFFNPGGLLGKRTV
tara:strand:- start:583 stop:1215 length:633 start_codon:yes stop_codon:yes gene_type:complete